MSIELINGHVLVADLPGWQGGVSLMRRWRTEIEETVTGAEDRGAMREVPRLRLRYEIGTRTQEQRAILEDKLRAALKSGKAAVPFWGRASDLANAASGTTAELATTNWPWQVDDCICFLDTSDLEKPVHAVRRITAKTGLTLTLNTALPQTFAAGSLVWPLLFGKPDADSAALTTSRQAEVKFTVSELVGSTRSSAASAPVYLGRSIYTTPINWNDRLNQRLTYDLRELAIGFGAEVFAPLQSHVVHGFEFNVQLHTEAEILAQENFFAALHGRLHGFWLPAPTEAVDIVGGLSTTQFDIKSQGLAATWDAHPAMHLWFTKGGTSAAGRIASVTDNGDGTERVTMEGAIAFAPDAETMVSRLHYVRLAEDDEQAQFQAEWFERRQLKVVELPLEYADAETGEQPVYLYHVWIDTTPVQHWYYTSFAGNIVSGGITYLARPINHGDMRSGLKGETEKVTIETVHEADHPFAFGFPYPPPKPVQVQILETTYADPDTTTVLFTGQVEKAPRRGKRISASCVSLLDLDAQRLPDALIGPRCSFQVYDANCGKLTGTYALPATLSLITGRIIRVTRTGGFPSNEDQYYTFGWIEYGSGLQTELRAILEDKRISGTVRELTLNLPLQHATTGSVVILLPGCDGKLGTCRTKFGNERFFGHPLVPEKNPTLSAVDNPVSQGGKK